MVYKKYILTPYFFLATLFGYATDVKAEAIDLFVLAGQSNMQGYQGDASRYPLDVKEYDKRILFYWVTPGESSSNDKWLTLQPQKGRFPAGHFGPEITFARNLYASGYNAAVFKYSQPATSLANDWKSPGDGGLYDNMVKELKNAVDQLAAQGKTVNIKAFIWVQGETDSESKRMSKKYKERLQKLIINFRNKVANNQSLPIVLGIDEGHPSVRKNQEVIESHKSIAENNKNIKFSSMIGLQKADSTHLTPDGLQYHGNRLFDTFHQIVKNNTIDKE